MNTSLELSMSLIERIYTLRRRFTHELMESVTIDEFPGFCANFNFLMNDKWQEYASLN